MKPLRPVGRDRDAGQTLDLDDVALALQLVGDVVGRQHADLVVVAEHRRRRGVRRGEQPVDVDDRDAGALGLLGDRRQRRAVLGQHDEGVGLLRDRLLDLLRLRVRVGRLEQLEVDVVVLRRPAALAFFEIAPSQPWSVGGTLAMMFTVLPDSSARGVRLAGGPVR